MNIIELYNKHLNEKVEKYWNIYHFDMELGHRAYNNEGDAFKHCYSQAELTLFLGAKIAEWIGVKHEDNNPYNTPAECNMDLHNNAAGRKIGKEIKRHNFFWFLTKFDDKIAEMIMETMSAGLLITEIKD